MSIDSESDALESIRKFEQYESSPITPSFISGLKSLAPLLNAFLPSDVRISEPALAAAVAGIEYVQAMAQNRADEFWHSLFRALGKKQKALEASKATLTPEQLEALQNEFMPLVLEGYRRAQQTRETERIRRIAQILANTIEFAARPDDSEEYMRVAQELSDPEVEFLRQMNDSPSLNYLNRQDIAMLTVEEANRDWVDHRPQINGVDESGHQSIGLKLQSFGLIESVERRAMVVGPNVTPYRLLKKGAQFIKFIQSHVE